MPFNKQKHLGQVFLKDKAIITKIIQAGRIKPQNQILEIGPGKGILTKALVEAEANVVAVEKDLELVKFLKNYFKDKHNLKIIQGDIRDFLKTNQFHTQYSILNPPYKVLGNIPYYLTAHLLRLILEIPEKPSLVIFMVQKEVAQRIISQPPKMNLLAVSVQFYAKPEIICYVSKNSFSPKPKVDSAVIKLTPYPVIALRQMVERQSFFKVVKAGFKQPRKLLLNNLSADLKIEKEIIKKAFKQLNIPLQIRAQNLSIKQWVSLTLLLIKNNV